MSARSKAVKSIWKGVREGLQRFRQGAPTVERLRGQADEIGSQIKDVGKKIVSKRRLVGKSINEIEQIKEQEKALRDWADYHRKKAAEDIAEVNANKKWKGVVKRRKLDDIQNKRDQRLKGLEDMWNPTPEEMTAAKEQLAARSREVQGMIRNEVGLRKQQDALFKKADYREAIGFDKSAAGRFLHAFDLFNENGEIKYTGTQMAKAAGNAILRTLDKTVHRVGSLSRVPVSFVAPVIPYPQKEGLTRTAADLVWTGVTAGGAFAIHGYLMGKKNEKIQAAVDATAPASPAAPVPPAAPTYTEDGIVKAYEVLQTAPTDPDAIKYIQGARNSGMWQPMEQKRFEKYVERETGMSLGDITGVIDDPSISSDIRDNLVNKTNNLFKAYQDLPDSVKWGKFGRP